MIDLHSSRLQAANFRFVWRVLNFDEAGAGGIPACRVESIMSVETAVVVSG
jgi:hypothetical protein